MTYNTWPSHIYDAVLRRAASLLQKRRGVKSGMARQGVRPTAAYDPFETRHYGGVRARDLVVAAEDKEALDQGQKRPGTAQRMLRYPRSFLRALAAYLRVKRAVALWETPLMEGYKPRREADRNAPPIERARRPYVWLSRPPTASLWKARNARYGFDIRATSPEHIASRVYSERAKLRAALTGPHGDEAATRSKDQDLWQGPPAPRDYAGSNDMLMIWPPVFLTGHTVSYSSPALRGRKSPVLNRSILNQAPVIPAKQSASRDLESGRALVKSHIISRAPGAEAEAAEFLDPLTAQYLWALTLFGHAGVRNFIAGLAAHETAYIENFEHHLCRAPP